MSQEDPRPWRTLYPPGLDESLVTRQSTLVDAWRERVDSSPDRAAVAYFDTTLSAREVDAMADALATALQVRGVAPGDRVGIHLRHGAGRASLLADRAARLRRRVGRGHPPKLPGPRLYSTTQPRESGEPG